MSINLGDLLNIFKTHFSMNDLENEFNTPVTLEFFGDEITAFAAASIIMPSAEIKIHSFPKTPQECERIRQSSFSLFFLDDSIIDIKGLSSIFKIIPPVARKKILCCIRAENDSLTKENVTSLFYKMALRKPIWYKSEKDFIERFIRNLGKSSFAAARLYPGLRDYIADDIIMNMSRDNAGIALISSIPPNLPVIGPIAGVLGVPGETVILTANQVRLGMRVAGIYGSEMDLLARMTELWPILATSFGWKALSRFVSGLAPVVGPLIKSSIAFSGTYAVGVAAKRFYRDRKILTSQELQEIYNFAKDKFSKTFKSRKK